MTQPINLANKVVCIDDDRIVHKLLEKLVPEEVVGFDGISNFLNSDFIGQPAGIFLDIYLGEEEMGTDFINVFNRRFPAAPVLVMTGSDVGSHVTDALEKGAADFIKKPLDSHEVPARLFKAQLEQKKHSVIDFGDITLDMARSEIRGLVKTEHVTAKSMQLMIALLHSPSFGMPRDELIRHIWGETKVCSNSLEQYLKKTRQYFENTTRNVEILTKRNEAVELIISVPAATRAA